MVREQVAECIELDQAIPLIFVQGLTTFRVAISFFPEDALLNLFFLALAESQFTILVHLVFIPVSSIVLSYQILLHLDSHLSTPSFTSLCL
jgi:hypothetical protein